MREGRSAGRGQRGTRRCSTSRSRVTPPRPASVARPLPTGSRTPPTPAPRSSISAHLARGLQCGARRGRLRRGPRRARDRGGRERRAREAELPRGLRQRAPVAATDQRPTSARLLLLRGRLGRSGGCPGVRMWTTLPVAGSELGAGYGYVDGTSFAAPVVAGIAALICATVPDAPTATGGATTVCAARLALTAEQIAGTGSAWYYGRVNACRAAAAGTERCPPPPPAPAATPVPTPVPTRSQPPCRRVVPAMTLVTGRGYVHRALADLLGPQYRDRRGYAEGCRCQPTGRSALHGGLEHAALELLGHRDGPLRAQGRTADLAPADRHAPGEPVVREPARALALRGAADRRRALTRRPASSWGPHLAPWRRRVNVLGGAMTELQRYLAEEVAEDHADGIITRREAMRRLGLLGWARPRRRGCWRPGRDRGGGERAGAEAATATATASRRARRLGAGRDAVDHVRRPQRHADGAPGRRRPSRAAACSSSTRTAA